MSTTEETKIDWSKPVQTKETPPRKVEILSMNGRGSCCVIGYIGDQSSVKSWTLDGKWSAIGGNTEIDLENTPTWKLPDLPPNQQWHRNDWTEEMLPAGYRPLLLGEVIEFGDENSMSLGGFDSKTIKGWVKESASIKKTAAGVTGSGWWRTTRPLTQQPEQWAAEKAAFAAGETIQFRHYTTSSWVDDEADYPAFGDPRLEFRVKPKQQKVPLGPCDVSVGDRLQFTSEGGFIADEENEGSMILAVTTSGILVASCIQGRSIGFIEHFTWPKLMPHKIKRPTDTEFQPCWKLIDPK